MAESCPNCGEKLAGAFCASCGQKRSPGLPTFKELIAESLNAVFSYDGKLWQTLKLLVTKPGELTREYIAGRRARYLGPFQLFFWLQGIAFLAHRQWFDSNQERADHKSLAILVIGVVYSLVVWALNRGSYVRALLFGSHVWSFLMVWLMAAYALALPISKALISAGLLHGEVQVGRFVTLTTILVVMTYQAQSLRRVFELNWSRWTVQMLAILAAMAVTVISLAKYL